MSSIIPCWHIGLVVRLPKFAGGLVAPFRGWPRFQEERWRGVAFFPLVPPSLWLQPLPLALELIPLALSLSLIPLALWLQPSQPLEEHAAAQVIQPQTRILSCCLSSQQRTFEDMWGICPQYLVNK